MSERMTEDERDEVDDGWRESTEGDLDPDLTEEAGYGWDPPTHQDWMPFAIRVVGIVLIVVLIASVVLPALL